MEREFLKLMEDWKDFGRPQSRLSEEAIVACLNLLENKAGDPPHVHEFKLREAITTADFPALFGGVIERDLLARYQTAPTVWQPYVKIRTVRDFRVVPLHKVQGNDNRLPEVPEKGEYKVSPTSESRYNLQVKKYGAQFDISWESIINDYLDAFGDIPQRFADAAVNTEAYIITSLIASASGPNPALFGNPITDVDGKNVVNVTNLTLTPQSLATVLSAMAMQEDANGKPLGVRGVHIVVPPALELAARSIITSTELRTTLANQTYGVRNVLVDLGLQIHVNPWLPVIDTTTGHTAWYVFADPSQGAALFAGRLRGQEQPEICMKDCNKVTVTGQHYTPFSGDFETDNIFYRVRLIFGGTQGDPRFAYASTGTVIPS